MWFLLHCDSALASDTGQDVADLVVYEDLTLARAGSVTAGRQVALTCIIVKSNRIVILLGQLLDKVTNKRDGT